MERACLSTAAPDPETEAPRSGSLLPRGLAPAFRRRYAVLGRSGGTGRRGGLKTRWGRPLASSNLAFGTSSAPRLQQTPGRSGRKQRRGPAGSPTFPPGSPICLDLSDCQGIHAPHGARRRLGHPTGGAPWKAARGRSSVDAPCWPPGRQEWPRRRRWSPWEQLGDGQIGRLRLQHEPRRLRGLRPQHCEWRHRLPGRHEWHRCVRLCRGV